MRRPLPLVVLLLACGRGSGASESAAPRYEDAAVPPADARPLVLGPAPPPGMAELAGFAYRTRGGQAAFRRAREAEASGDWAAVVERCRVALDADRTHLDAMYLLAVALAKTGASADEIFVPLENAVAGDFAKWGLASLRQPALQPFLETPRGELWRRRVDALARDYAQRLARSLVVTANGDLFAHDAAGDRRWYRLTRTGGAVVGALHVRSLKQLVYVTRQRVKAGGKLRTRVGVGVVDLATGILRRAVEVPSPAAATAALRVGYSTHKTPSFIVRAGKVAWRIVEGDDGLALERLPAKVRADAPAHLAEMMWLEVRGRSARLHRMAVPDVSADWDDATLASAIRVGRSKRVITVPSPGLIDGDTATWSPDGTKLAFVAQLSDTCEPNVATTAAFVADAATGTVRELERATGGIAIEWSSDQGLAIAGDRGVSIVPLAAGAAPQPLVGADGLVTPREKPTCVPEPVIEAPLADDEDTATEGSAGSQHLPPDR